MVQMYLTLSVSVIGILRQNIKNPSCIGFYARVDIRCGSGVVVPTFRCTETVYSSQVVAVLSQENQRRTKITASL